MRNILGDLANHIDLENICTQIELPSKTCDDRETIEQPATEWIFSCPTLDWLQHAEKNQTNMWTYQFRTVMPLGLVQKYTLFRLVTDIILTIEQTFQRLMEIPVGKITNDVSILHVTQLS